MQSFRSRQLFSRRVRSDRRFPAGCVVWPGPSPVGVRTRRSAGAIPTALGSAVLGAAVSGLFISGASAALVINEVLYDPAGSDGGLEYVELFNPGPASESLDGVALDAGNGSRAEDWAVQWSAPAGRYMEPGAFLWIGGRPPGVSGYPDFEETLHIQNGPDAVRLRRGDDVIDVVGWGDHEHAEYFESSPAPDVGSGQSLGRVPDGRDADDNAADLVPLAALSPGLPNERQPSLLLRIDTVEPAVTRPGEGVAWTATLTNRSQEDVSLLGATVRWDGHGLDVGLPTFLASEASHVFSWPGAAPESPGPHRPELVVETTSETVAVQGALRVGTGPLVVSEIHYDPVPEESEWVELLVREPVARLEGWTLSDAGGTVLEITDGRPGAVGDRFVLAQDRKGVSGLPDTGDSRLLEASGSWPSLNNAHREDLGAADVLLLRDSLGTPSDLAPYDPVPGSGDGVSLVRRVVEWPPHPSREWIPSPDGGSSPGRAGLLDSLDPLPGGLRIDPQVIDPARHRGAVILVPPGRGAAQVSWEAAVYDLSGRRRRLLGLRRGTGLEPAFWWDGTVDGGLPAASGTYIVRVREWSASGASEQWVATVGVGR